MGISRMPPDFGELRRHFVERNYLLTLHASERAAERGILSHEIEAAIINGQVIEEISMAQVAL